MPFDFDHCVAIDEKKADVNGLVLLEQGHEGNYVSMSPEQFNLRRAGIKSENYGLTEAMMLLFGAENPGRKKINPKSKSREIKDWIKGEKEQFTKEGLLDRYAMVCKKNVCEGFDQTGFLQEKNVKDEKRDEEKDEEKDVWRDRADIPKFLVPVADLHRKFFERKVEVDLKKRPDINEECEFLGILNHICKKAPDADHPDKENYINAAKLILLANGLWNKDFENFNFEENLSKCKVLVEQYSSNPNAINVDYLVKLKFLKDPVYQTTYAKLFAGKLKSEPHQTDNFDSAINCASSPLHGKRRPSWRDYCCSGVLTGSGQRSARASTARSHMKKSASTSTYPGKQSPAPLPTSRIAIFWSSMAQFSSYPVFVPWQFTPGSLTREGDRMETHEVKDWLEDRVPSSEPIVAESEVSSIRESPIRKRPTHQLLLRQ